MACLKKQSAKKVKLLVVPGCSSFVLPLWLSSTFITDLIKSIKTSQESAEMEAVEGSDGLDGLTRSFGKAT